MSGQEPLDLVIILRIVEYMGLRARSGREIDSIDSAAIMNIVNNMAPGSSLGMVLHNETNDGQEVRMGDEYHVSGQVGSVGRNAKAENFTQNQIAVPSSIDLKSLAAELETLRAAMRRQAGTTEEDMAIVEVGKALVAAQDGDEASTVSHLKRAGKWALGIASSIGTGVAASAIKAALGL